MSDAPFPAVPALDLGTTVAVSLDAALIPYLIGAVEELRDPSLYVGAAADVEATAEAMQALIITLANAV